MVGKFGKSLGLVLVLTLVITGVVYAEGDPHHEKTRFLGEITNIDLDIGSFSLHSQTGEDLRFITIEPTQFRSRDGSIQTLKDLSPGMKALVSAFWNPDGNLVALMIAAGQEGDYADVHRFNGTIFNVDVEQSSFSLQLVSGVIQQFVVCDRTHYRSRDGSISELADLESGLIAHVVATDKKNQASLALVVAAGKPAETPGRFRVIGQIRNVITGQETFELEAKNGEILNFNVKDRTIFQSRNGSIYSIHDLKRGMHALVVGVRDKDGSLISLLVAAADLEDTPGLSALKVRAIGKITSLGDRTFTLETQGQGSLSFSVDGSTIYKARDGSMPTYEDLRVGMTAVVGGKMLDNGEIKAVVVGVGLRNTERVDLSDQVRPAMQKPVEKVSD